MAVYVDPIHNIVEGGPACFAKGACHLYADSLDELHKFALKIGMKRSWYQDHPRLKHYDLTIGKRWQAVVKGAIEHTTEQAVDKWKKLRTQL